ncbi:hypothetical protein PEC301877_20880 [Pectobacterium carotovorum subsp. carotovorum]|nr:hypothetical protein PEC301877_20880 [Pectobacterium carotovorum subsp. carotovorum]
MQTTRSSQSEQQVNAIKKASEKTRWLVKRHHYSECFFLHHLEPMTIFVVGHVFQVPLRRLL